MVASEAKRLRELELENGKLKRLLAGQNSALNLELRGQIIETVHQRRRCLVSPRASLSAPCKPVIHN